MASTAQQQATAGSPQPDPQVVGNAFVHQYYHILFESPELVFRFYQDSSKLGRPEDNGAMGSVSTLQAINEKILSLYMGGFGAEIKTVDAQDSHDGAVIVLVTGKLMGKDNIKRNFTQTFFLAPQLPPLEKSYFVLNDIFRYVEDADSDESQHLSVEVEAPVTPDREASVAQENHVLEQMNGSSEGTSGEEVYNPPVNEEILAAEEEQPVPEVVDEVEDDLQLVTELNSKIEDAPKKSYASIVKILKENGEPFKTITPTPLRPLPKQEKMTSAPQPVAPQHEASITKSNSIENGNSQEGEADGHSIYIKGLPMRATATLLEAEFKKYGTIKKNGIQVRSNKGFCFGFVEFEEMTAAIRAIEASPVTIGEHQAYVEKKSSNSRGNNRGRFSNGRGGGGGGGFRNEGARGRGNFGGGRGYNHADFNNRNEFGSRSEFGNRNIGRGGYQIRDGDGYQRSDIAGSNGGRMNRGGSIQ